MTGLSIQVAGSYSSITPRLDKVTSLVKLSLNRRFNLIDYMIEISTLLFRVWRIPKKNTPNLLFEGQSAHSFTIKHCFD